MTAGGEDRCFQLRLTPTVRRMLAERLPEAVAFAAFEFINGPLLENPWWLGKRLLPPLADRYVARRGTYRLVYRIDDQARTVTVVDIDHRSTVYRPH